MSDDLVTFLRAQLDEEQRLANLLPMGFAAHGQWSEDDLNAITWACNPARVLAEVAAKRAIIDIHDPGDTTKTRWWCAYCRDPDKPVFMARMPCHHLRLLALPYVNQPGYQPQWAPSKEEQ